MICRTAKTKTQFIRSGLKLAITKIEKHLQCQQWKAAQHQHTHKEYDKDKL